MPYYEAILLELKEEGYQESFDYLTELLDFDEKITEKMLGSLLWKKPSLKDQRDIIICLKNGLVASEKSKSKGMKEYDSTKSLRRYYVQFHRLSYKQFT